MAWPIPVSSGENILAEQYNVVLDGVQNWAGQVNGHGNSLINAILPAPTGSSLGAVKAGTGITIAVDGTISAAAFPPPYTLPVASTTVLGGVKQGSGCTIAGDGTLTVPGGGYVLPVATASVLGGVKQGVGVSIAADGTLSAEGAWYIAAANYTATPTDGNIIAYNGNSGAITITLPASPAPQQRITVKSLQAIPTKVTASLIDSSSTGIYICQNGSLTVVWNSVYNRWAVQSYVESDWVTWTPNIRSGGAGTASLTVNTYAEWKAGRNVINLRCNMQVTTSGGVGSFDADLPLPCQGAGQTDAPKPIINAEVGGSSRVVLGSCSQSASAGHHYYGIPNIVWPDSLWQIQYHLQYRYQ